MELNLGLAEDEFHSTLEQIEDFLRSGVWYDIKREITERLSLVRAKLEEGDDTKKWSDDNMRGRISELKYLETIPEALLDVMKAKIEVNKLDKEK